jgi:hypothetical protein
MIIIKLIRSSVYGRRLMTERSLLQTPSEETILYTPFIWINSMEQKEIMECSSLPGIVVACAVISLMVGWTLRTAGL